VEGNRLIACPLGALGRLLDDPFAHALMRTERGEGVRGSATLPRKRNPTACHQRLAGPSMDTPITPDTAARRPNRNAPRGAPFHLDDSGRGTPHPFREMW